MTRREQGRGGRRQSRDGLRHSRDGLRDAVAVVTGAGRGIGAALAVSLAQAGARIAAVGLEPDELAATVARCGPGAGARAWTADVTGSDRMQAVAAEVGAHFGRVDVVVANAGIGLGGLFGDADPAAFSRVIEVNLLGSAATARAFLPALLASRGYYLQVASLAALAPASQPEEIYCVRQYARPQVCDRQHDKHGREHGPLE